MRVRSHRHRRHLLPIRLPEYFEQELGGWLFEPMANGTLKDADFQVAFCESILARMPEHAEALALLGEAYTARGEIEKGLQTDLRLSRLKPHSGTVHYNLACSYALMGKKDEALETLKRALELGYSDREHLCNDSDLQSLRDDPRYQTLIEEWPAAR
jgi:tetratricopeptide (TPR) repeat protein